MSLHTGFSTEFGGHVLPVQCENIVFVYSNFVFEMNGLWWPGTWLSQNLSQSFFEKKVVFAKMATGKILQAN